MFIFFQRNLEPFGNRLPKCNLNWVGADIVKVELNDARSGKICKSPVSSRLVRLDGTWWVIDVNDPDLEAHLKQSARCPDSVTRSAIRPVRRSGRRLMCRA